MISYAPFTSTSRTKTQNQLLGECDVTIFGADRLAARYRPGFPASLDKAPFLLPSSGSPLRQSLDRWMEDLSVRPWVRGTFADGALLKSFGRAGVGLFAAPSAIEDEIKEEYNVRVVGRVDAIRERFFVVSTRRKVQHPALAAISYSARNRLFG